MTTETKTYSETSEAIKSEEFGLGVRRDGLVVKEIARIDGRWVVVEETFHEEEWDAYEDYTRRYHEMHQIEEWWNKE